MNKNAIVLLILFISINFNLNAEKMIIKYLKTAEDSVRYSYQYELIDNIINKTSNYYPDTEISIYTKQMNSSRLNYEAVSGEKINLIWSDVGHKELDNNMTVIPIPLTRGLLGYRIFFIRNSDEAIFSSIKTLDELKKLKAGQGANWGDIKILKYNNIKVVEGINYSSLFPMLVNNRFDYFPRGVNEVFFEYNAKENEFPEISIENTICIHYFFPDFFYVSKNSPKLAKRIEMGLNIMIKDGSFDIIFNKYFKKCIEKANLKNRKIFEIKNPFLPDFVPINKKEFWFTP